MDIMNYIKPELVVVAIALYFIGMWIKKSEVIKDKYIPIAVGAIGVILALVYVLATTHFRTWQDALMAIFIAVVQGILVAGLSTYINQLIKQNNKQE